jgi:LysM repeat protein
MTDLTHTEAQNLLAGGLALSLQNQADLQFHLAGCAECRFYAELHTRLATELPALYSATAVSFVQQPGFLHTFQEAIDRQNMSRNFVKETRFWLGIAVILVIILIVGWAVRTLAPAPQPGQGVANTPSRTETPTITATFDPSPTNFTSQIYPPPVTMPVFTVPANTITPFPAGQPACSPRYDWVYTHTVQIGETLYHIASQYGITPNELAAGNCISILGMMYPGQILRVPIAKPFVLPTITPTFAPSPTPSPNVPAANPASLTYIVRAGDTCMSIANQFGLLVSQLIEANQLPQDCSTLVVGQQLLIP